MSSPSPVAAAVFLSLLSHASSGALIIVFVSSAAIYLLTLLALVSLLVLSRSLLALLITIFQHRRVGIIGAATALIRLKR
jgi:hypothetical protein